MSTDIDGFAGFLDVVDFDYFATFTTRKPIGLNATRRIAENVCRFLGADKGISSVFWAAEPFDVREGYHFHALIKTPIHQMEIYDYYFDRHGRCQIIVNRDPAVKRAASYYLTKYITKKCSDYDFHFSDEIKNRNQIRAF